MNPQKRKEYKRLKNQIANTAFNYVDAKKSLEERIGWLAAKAKEIEGVPRLNPSLREEATYIDETKELISLVIDENQKELKRLKKLADKIK